jgi:hypothetical protein
MTEREGGLAGGTDDLPPLYHYSAQPLGDLRQTSQAPREGGQWSFVDKPRGLWLSVGDEWEVWSRENEFNLAGLTHRARVIVTDPGKLLRLESVDEISAFQRKYEVVHTFMRSPGIHWARVAEQYAGILIAPYQWSLRLDLMWYYGWDCASGCIWDTTVIERIECSAIDTRAEPT